MIHGNSKKRGPVWSLRRAMLDRVVCLPRRLEDGFSSKKEFTMKINDFSKAQYQGLKMHSFARRRCGRQRTSEMFLILAMLFFLAALIAPGVWRRANASGGQPPVAGDDFYTVLEDQTLVVEHPGLFANDSDPEYDHFLAHYLLPAKYGTVYIVANQGAFSYTPNKDFNGTDSFTYRLREIGTGRPSNIATVTITVIPVNDPPTAHDDRGE